jgi:hypothetical protein
MDVKHRLVANVRSKSALEKIAPSDQSPKGDDERWSGKLGWNGNVRWESVQMSPMVWQRGAVSQSGKT